MTKDKFLLSVIDVLIAPVTVMYFVYENYSHKDYSECFQEILKYYQIYMLQYDEVMESISEMEEEIQEEFLDTLLVCELNRVKNKFVKKFLNSLENEIVKKHIFRYDIYERYGKLREKNHNELCVYIDLLKELRKMEELGS